MIDRRLLYLAVGVGGLGLGLLTFLYANSWWLSGLITLSIGCWLAGVLLAAYTPRDRRAAPLGALICSFLYLLLVGGPWFGQHVGPWLLTTRALVAIDTHLLGHQQPPALTTAPATSWIYSTGYNTSWTVPQQPAYWPIPVAVSSTVVGGQWLLAWCAAAIGGLVARWLARRAERTGAVPSPAVPSASLASPFAETVR